MPNTPSPTPQDLPEEIATAIRKFANACLFGMRSADAALVNRNVRNGVDALTAAILSRLGQRWQPIATAPRDDEENILVCDARVAGGFHQVVWWDADSKQPEYRWDTSDGPKFHRDAFTHWMPLPAPPVFSEAQPQGDR